MSFTPSMPTVTICPPAGRRKPRPFKPFRVYVNHADGVMSKAHEGVTTLRRALAYAAKLSNNRMDDVVVHDDSLPMNQRMLAIYKRGIRIFDRIDSF